MKRVTKPPFASIGKFFCGLFLSLSLVGCGGNGEEVKEIERLREEVARLKSDNGLTDSKGEETDRDASWKQPSFPPLPLKWQSKGGIAEATEDLRALHLAAQRYLDANDDVWPQAPRSIHLQFWEAELKPFGATAEHWRHSEHPLKDKQPYYRAFPIEAKKGAPYQIEDRPWFGTRPDLGGVAIQVEILSTGQVRYDRRSADHLVNLPVDARNQSLTQSTGNLAKINILKSGAYVLMGKQFTEEQVSEWLKAKFDKTPDLKVLIRCDIDTKHLYLANVLSICRHVGVPKANIAVKTEK
jgi:biopolymer transport protein ExbD